MTTIHVPMVQDEMYTVESYEDGRRYRWTITRYIKPDGDGWAVYVATEPGPNVPATPVRLRWLDDAEAAARTMCAYWRVPYLPLEPDTTGDDL